jgi:hypothetical protein
VVPGITGEVCAVGAVDSLSAHISRLTRDTDYRTTLSRNAVRHVDRYDVRMTVAGTLRAVHAVSVARAGESPRAVAEPHIEWHQQQ